MKKCFLIICCILLTAAFSLSAQDHSENFCINSHDQSTLDSLLIDLQGETSFQKRFTVAGLRLLSSTYTPKLLDQSSNEELWVNLAETDCQIFVENMLAISGYRERIPLSSQDIANDIKDLRYKDGQVSYLNRLHYFSDWIITNKERFGFVDMGEVHNTPILRKKVEFMSSHAQSYSRLANSEETVNGIKIIEKQVSTYTFHYIPRAEVHKYYPLMKHGDIIAVTTNIPGLYVSHTGFIWKQNDDVHLLHASSSKQEVVISSKDLQAYLLANKRSTGIFWLRVNAL